MSEAVADCFKGYVMFETLIHIYLDNQDNIFEKRCIFVTFAKCLHNLNLIFINTFKYGNKLTVQMFHNIWKKNPFNLNVFVSIASK